MYSLGIHIYDVNKQPKEKTWNLLDTYLLILKNIRMRKKVFQNCIQCQSENVKKMGLRSELDG